MIFSALQTVGIYIFNAVLSIFPTVDGSSLAAVNSFYTSVRSTLAGVSWIMPTDTLFQIFGYILIIEFSVLMFRVIRWVANLISAGLIRA